VRERGEAQGAGGASQRWIWCEDEAPRVVDTHSEADHVLALTVELGFRVLDAMVGEED